MPLLEHLRRLLPQGSGITDRDLSRFISTLVRHRIRKGDSLSLHTAAVAGVVANGCLRVYFTEPDGSDRVLYFAPEGWCLAGVADLAVEGASPVLRVEALEPTEVWIAPEGCVPVKRLSRRFDRIRHALTEAALATVQRRLAGGLRKDPAQRYVDFRRLYPDLDARIPQYHVAAYLGVSPEFFSKLRKRVLRHGVQPAPS